MTTVERIRERYAKFVAGFPTANRTTLYQRALAFSEWLAQIAEDEREAAAPAATESLRAALENLANRYAADWGNDVESSEEYVAARAALASP